jgi:hypothetical protein
MTDLEINIDASLVSKLIIAQFPQWAHLPIRPVAHIIHPTFRVLTR